MSFSRHGLAWPGNILPPTAEPPGNHAYTACMQYPDSCGIPSAHTPHHAASPRCPPVDTSSSTVMTTSHDSSLFLISAWMPSSGATLVRVKMAPVSVMRLTVPVTTWPMCSDASASCTSTAFSDSTSTFFSAVLSSCMRARRGRTVVRG